MVNSTSFTLITNAQWSYQPPTYNLLAVDMRVVGMSSWARLHSTARSVMSSPWKDGLEWKHLQRQFSSLIPDLCNTMLPLHKQPWKIQLTTLFQFYGKWTNMVNTINFPTWCTWCLEWQDARLEDLWCWGDPWTPGLHWSRLEEWRSIGHHQHIGYLTITSGQNCYCSLTKGFVNWTFPNISRNANQYSSLGRNQELARKGNGQKG